MNVQWSDEEDRKWGEIITGTWRQFQKGDMLQCKVVAKMPPMCKTCGSVLRVGQWPFCPDHGKSRLAGYVK